MKTKSMFSFALASLFLLVLFANLSSAVVITSAPSTLKQDSSSFTFNVTGSSNVSESVTFKIEEIVDGSSKIEFSISPLTIDLTNESDEKITVTYSTTNFPFRFLETYSLNLNVQSNSSQNDSKTIKFEETNYCDYPLSNNLRLTIESIEVVSGFGDRDRYYFPMDEIEIEVEYRYRGLNRDDEFLYGEIEWELYASNGRRVLSDKFSINDLEYNDQDSEIFKIFLDADDLVRDIRDYTLYVRLSGEEYLDDTGESKDICMSVSKTIRLENPRDFLVVSNVRFPEQLSPGEEFVLYGSLWNIGSRSQDDSYIIISNSLLGIDEKITFSEIRSFNKRDFSINLKIPSDAAERTYSLNIKVYDSRNRVYENNKRDEANFNFFIDVKGASQVLPKVLLNAYLQGEAVEGNEIKVKSVLTNLGTSSQTYIVKIEDYSSWASLKSTQSQIIIVNQGESKEFEILFDSLKQSSGERNFNLQVYSVDNVLIETQPVQINIQSKSGFSNLFENWYIWLIAGLNIILVLVIILVVIKILRR